jgi:hypothetical protein
MGNCHALEGADGKDSNRAPRRWPTSLDEGRPGEAVPNRVVFSTTCTGADWTGSD